MVKLTLSNVIEAEQAYICKEPRPSSVQININNRGSDNIMASHEAIILSETLLLI